MERQRVEDLEGILKTARIDIQKTVSSRGIQDDMYTWMTYSLPGSLQLVLHDVEWAGAGGENTYRRAELLTPRLSLKNEELAEYANSIAKRYGLELQRGCSNNYFFAKLEDPSKLTGLMRQATRAYGKFMKQQDHIHPADSWGKEPYYLS